MRALAAAASIPQANITTHAGTARFPSIAQWVYTDIKGWTLAELLDDEQFAWLALEAEAVLQPFVQPDGSVDLKHLYTS